MNALREFFSREAGQARRNALENALQTYVAEPMNYFLGPSGIPDKLQTAGNIFEYTDAGDMQAAAQASNNLWNNPTIGNAAEYAAAGIALGLPFYSNALGEGIMSVADDMVAAYDPNTVGAFRVWHGSPHDFDKFSLDKIGTGEGAQIDGRGLYFSDYEVDAMSYRKPDARIGRLGQKSKFDGDGVIYEVGIDAEPGDFVDTQTPVKNLPDHIQNVVAPYFRASDEFAKDRKIEFYISPNRDVEGSLRAAGVKGLKKETYSGDTHYVLFDDSLAHILSKNGEPQNTAEAERMRKLVDYLNEHRGRK